MDKHLLRFSLILVLINTYTIGTRIYANGFERSQKKRNFELAQIKVNWSEFSQAFWLFLFRLTLPIKLALQVKPFDDRVQQLNI